MSPSFSLADPYDVALLDSHPDRLPLVVRARTERDVDKLAAWLRGRPEWMTEQLTRWGAVLFRGFDVHGPASFEKLARAVDPDLKDEYLGASPRSSTGPKVFLASQLPGHYPIAQHCELSFVREPPRHLFFACFEPPPEGSGETPLADFRKVLADVDTDLRSRLESRGLRIVRNYAGPHGAGRFAPWPLERWDQMFGTTERRLVERRCVEQGFDITWTESDGLRVVSSQAVVRRHPTTGVEAWHNHLTAFHLSRAAGEYDHIRRFRPSLRHHVLWWVARILERRLRGVPSDELAMQVTHLDGSAIADEDVAAVRDVIWRHLVIVPWKRGDVLAIDNYAVSHGRLPYTGKRRVAAAWA